MKLNSSHVFSKLNSQVFHSIFTCFYPIVKEASGKQGIEQGYLHYNSADVTVHQVPKYINRDMSTDISWLRYWTSVG